MLWEAVAGSTFPAVLGGEVHFAPLARGLAPTAEDLQVLELYLPLRGKGDAVELERLERALEASGLADGERVALAVGVTKDLTGRVKAGDLMRELAAILGGKGGGWAAFVRENPGRTR